METTTLCLMSSTFFASPNPLAHEQIVKSEVSRSTLFLHVTVGDLRVVMLLTPSRERKETERSLSAKKLVREGAFGRLIMPYHQRDRCGCCCCRCCYLFSCGFAWERGSDMLQVSIFVAGRVQESERERSISASCKLLLFLKGRHGNVTAVCWSCICPS